MAVRELDLSAQTEPLEQPDSLRGRTGSEPTIILPVNILGTIDTRGAEGDLVYYLEGKYPSLGVCHRSTLSGGDETVVSNLTLLQKNVRLRGIS